MTNTVVGDIFLPPPPPASPLSSTNVMTIDATGEMAAFLGRAVVPGGGSRTIERAGILFGTVVKAGGSVLRLSLQNLSTTVGPVFVPDEVQDEFVDIPTGDPVSATWYRTPVFSAGRTVTNGDLLAVVIEFDAAGRLGADSYGIRRWDSIATPGGHAACATKLAGVWAQAAGAPILVLEDNAGGFITLDGAMPIDSLTISIAFNNASAADEIGLEFVSPVSGNVMGAWLYIQTTAGTSDFDVVLYSGTTAIATASVDANQLRTANSFLPVQFTALAAITQGTTYRLVVKPTTANNVTFFFQNVNSAAHLSVTPPFLSGWNYVTRVDAGSWAAATTTRRPMIGLRMYDILQRSPRANSLIGI